MSVPAGRITAGASAALRTVTGEMDTAKTLGAAGADVGGGPGRPGADEDGGVDTVGALFSTTTPRSPRDEVKTHSDPAAKRTSAAANASR